MIQHARSKSYYNNVLYFSCFCNVGTLFSVRKHLSSFRCTFVHYYFRTATSLYTECLPCSSRNRLKMYYFKCQGGYSVGTKPQTSFFLQAIPGLEDMKLFSCSTQLSTEFQLLIKTKIPSNEEVNCFKSLRCDIYHAHKC